MTSLTIVSYRNQKRACKRAGFDNCVLISVSEQMLIQQPTSNILVSAGNCEESTGCLDCDDKGRKPLGKGVASLTEFLSSSTSAKTRDFGHRGGLVITQLLPMRFDASLAKRFASLAIVIQTDPVDSSQLPADTNILDVDC